MRIHRKDLSEEQETAFQTITTFIDSTDKQMLLYGSAGTGKTSLLNCLLDYIDAQYDLSVVCTAPTNEAVRVIGKATNRDYESTIFSLLGLVLIQNDDKPPVLSPDGDSQLEEFDLIFVDESSMIDSELYQLIQEQLKTHSRVKIIYIGDSAQLPPVKDKGVDSPVFKLEKQIGLSTVQRLAKDNPIIETVTLIRNNIESPVDVFPRISKLSDDGKSGIEFTADKEYFLKNIYNDFLSEEYKNDDNYVRVIAYTNKTVNAMNIHIRRKIYGTRDVPEYMPDEKLIVDVPITKERRGKKNKVFKEIVYSVGERLQIKSLELKTDPEYGIKFWDMCVVNYEARGIKKVTSYIRVIHKSYVELYKKALTMLANEAKDKVINQKINKGAAWGPFYAFKDSFNWVKYFYASTSHKAQGSTIKNVYVIENDLNTLTWNHSERNKLKYVAFTRASKLLRVYS